MFTEVSVLAGEPKDLVTVPRTAVTYTLYGDSVWVATQAKPEAKPEAEKAPTVAADASGEAKSEEGKSEETKADAPGLTVERRFVRVGPVQENRVAIVEGVKAGEQVVTSGQLKLQPGAAIKIDNADALKAPAVMPKQ